MSYEIIYRTKSSKIPESKLRKDAMTHFNIGDVTNLPDLLISHYGIYSLRDMHAIYFECGASNCYDSDNKRCRDWILAGIGSYDDVLLNVGINWAMDIESGCIKPQGRWSTAASWVKKVSSDLSNPNETLVPSSLMLKLETPNDWYDKHLLDVFLADLEGLTLEIEQRKSFLGTMNNHITLRPKNSFEVFLFHFVTKKHYGNKILNQENVYFF